MARTTFSGPLASGTLEAGVAGGPNIGLPILSQIVTLGFDATLVQSATLYIPANSRITSTLIDVLTAYNSATSATLSVGSAAAGVQYVSGVDAKTAGRAAPTLTATQLTNMLDTTSSTSVVATVTSVGQPTAGSTRITVNYVQTGA